MRRERWNQYDYQRFSREPWQSCRLSSVGDAAMGLRLDRLSTNLSATGLSNRKFKDSRLKLRESQRERERESERAAMIIDGSTNSSPKTRILKFPQFYTIKDPPGSSKTGPVLRFRGSTAVHAGSCRFNCLTGLNGLTEPFYGPVDGSTGWTGRFGPGLKTLMV